MAIIHYHFYDGVKFYVSSQEHFHFVLMYFFAWFLKQALLHIKGGKHLPPWETLKNTKGLWQRLERAGILVPSDVMFLLEFSSILTHCGIFTYCTFTSLKTDQKNFLTWQLAIMFWQHNIQAIWGQKIKERTTAAMYRLWAAYSRCTSLYTLKFVSLLPSL